MAELVKRDAYLMKRSDFQRNTNDALRATRNRRGGCWLGLRHQQRRIFPFIHTIRILAFLFAHAIKRNSLSRNQVMSYTGPA
jgi:hypothetical protein